MTLLLVLSPPPLNRATTSVENTLQWDISSYPITEFMNKIEFLCTRFSQRISILMCLNDTLVSQQPESRFQTIQSSSFLQFYAIQLKLVPSFLSSHDNIFSQSPVFMKVLRGQGEVRCQFLPFFIVSDRDCQLPGTIFGMKKILFLTNVVTF